MTRRPRRGPALLAVLVALVAGSLTGCGHSRPAFGNAQVQRWLQAISVYGAAGQGTDSFCYLFRAKQLSSLPHPSTTWSVQGTNDEVTNFNQKYVGCKIFAGPHGSGVAPAGIGLDEEPVQPTASNAFPTEPGVQVTLPGTTYALLYTAWPNRKPTGAEVAQAEKLIIANLSAKPPTSPLDAGFVGPATTFPAS